VLNKEDDGARALAVAHLDPSLLAVWYGRETPIGGHRYYVTKSTVGEQVERAAWSVRVPALAAAGTQAAFEVRLGALLPLLVTAGDDAAQLNVTISLADRVRRVYAIVARCDHCVRVCRSHPRHRRVRMRKTKRTN
jgi:hypothetical protein